MRKRMATTMLIVVGLIASGDTLRAQEDPAEVSRFSRNAWVVEALFSGGPLGFAVGMTLVAMSVAAVALTIDGVLTLRKKNFAPPGLADTIRQLLATGNHASADQACHSRPSMLSLVVRSGISEADSPWPAIEKRMEDMLAAQAARLARKFDYLALVAQLAPMVGLFGTIIGIYTAFHTLAGDKLASLFARGMAQVLVSTELGLLIAIPAWAATVILRIRAEHLTSTVAEAAELAMSPLKHVRTLRGPVPPPPPGGSH